MSELVPIVTYYCELCKNTRNFEMNHSSHLEKISENSNGLVLYSDIHHCEDGILGVNNLQIDANYDVRSFEVQELPPVRPTPKFAIPGIGAAVKKTNPFKKLFITHLHPNMELKLLIKDESLLTIMNIGVNDEEVNFPIQTITSDLGGVTVSFYESEIYYSPSLEQWLHVLVNSLEILPPTRFGLLIETMRYMLNLHNQEPTNFDISLIKTILASHEIYFQATTNPDRFDNIAVKLSSKVTEKDSSFLMELLAYLEMHPQAPLIEYIKTHHHDFEYLIYLFLVLENEGLIIIDRPGIVDC